MRSFKSKKRAKSSTVLMVYPKNYPKKNTQSNISNIYDNSQNNEYGLYRNANAYKTYDPNFSDFISEQSFNLNNFKNPKNHDSFSDNSFSLNFLPKHQEKLNKSFNPFSINKKKDDSNFFGGFEFQVISPIPSLSTTKIYKKTMETDEQEKDLEEDKDEANDFDFNTSRKFIEDIIDED